MSYYTLLTADGAAEWAAAEIGAIDNVPITHLAVGDGNGAPVIPSGSATALVHEVHRVLISSIIDDPVHPNWLIVEAVIPVDIGGFTVREIGLIGGSGVGNKLLAMGNFPTTDKPLPADGAARDMMIRMVIQVTNTSVVQITVDPSIALATQQTVNNAIDQHEADPDPHPQYVALLAQHIEDSDPHPQYLTQAEGDARYNRKARHFFNAQI